MRHLKIVVEASVLVAAVFFSLASGWVDDDDYGGSFDEDTDSEDDWFNGGGDSVSGWDETWVVSNLFDGQTAVPTNHVIRLAIGYSDFSSGGPGHEVDQAMDLIELDRITEGNQKISVDFQVIVEQNSTFVHVPFEEDTMYTLDVHDLITSLDIDRIFPGTVTFYTGSAPGVTGVWRNDDTLIISFSEPMDEETLTLSQGSVDVMWEQGGDLHSFAADLNLADFVWDSSGYLFRMAPVELSGAAWVMVSSEVAGESGETLDGNNNWNPGEPEDTFLKEYDFSSLPVCYTREDIPAPCVSDPEIPTSWGQ